MSAGEMSAGEMPAGEMPAGEMPAGEMSAGAIIHEIEEFDDKLRWEGCKITIKRNEKLSHCVCKMDTIGQCCELFSIVVKIPKNIIGATLGEVTVVEEEYETEKYDIDDRAYRVVFTMETSVGPIVITCSNVQNGYYSHDVYVKTDKLDKYIRI
jgi:hypothetical protein